MESIVCNGIGKIYGKKQVLKNINLTLEKGKIYGLIGRNGAGKTLLSLYIGVGLVLNVGLQPKKY